MASDGEGRGCLVLIVFLLVGVWGIREIYDHVFDSTGYVSHRVQSTITAQSEWMVGETKDCASYPLDAKEAKLKRKREGYAFSFVECDNGPAHKIQVTFWGAEYQPGKLVAEWKCTRKSNSFVCKQTGAF